MHSGVRWVQNNNAHGAPYYNYNNLNNNSITARSGTSGVSPHASSRRGPPKECNLCSFLQPPPEVPRAVYHRHWSSKEIRRVCGSEKSGQSYLCPTCGESGALGKMHKPNETERLKILVSSSTMHEYFYGGKYTGDKIHIDYVTIPGATIQILEKAWRRDYEAEKRPMDVIVVAGLNNVKNETVARIMKHIEEFCDTVRVQSTEHHPGKPSTFSFSSIRLNSHGSGTMVLFHVKDIRTN